MNPRFVPIVIGFFVMLILLMQAVFIVDQRSQAIVLQLGEPVGNLAQSDSFIKGPGLHFKIPFIQSLRFFDRRVLPVDPPPEQVVISGMARGASPKALSMPAPAAPVEIVPENVGGEPIIVDTFARYKITDPLQFMKTLRTIANADDRLESILNNATRSVLGQTTLKTLLSPERERVMNEIKTRVNDTIEQARLGIEIVDVRIVRADLTADLRTSTVRRMISELQERATQTRAMGEERALQIRAEAERERDVILAEARRKAEILKGEGDQEAITIYTKAFNRDPSFYAFWRTMEAYRNTLSDPDTQLILSPDSGFLRYLNQHP